MSNLGQYNAGIISTGRALPIGKITNADLETILETSDDWIQTRTGIQERRMVTGDETNSDLCVTASRIALERAGLKAEEVDLLIVSTVTPDLTLPSASCLVQSKLQARNAFVFDLVAGCSGFLYGLTVAEKFIQAGTVKNVLLVGVDVLTPIMDWQDRNTCVLFGDGAGAAVITRVEAERGLMASKLYADGDKAELLYTPAGGTKNPANYGTVEDRMHFVRMNGKEIFKFAVKVMTESTLEVLNICELSPTNLDYLIPHQANIRIIESASKKLGLRPEQVIVNIERFGNMSSASIPVALDEAVESGKIKEGHLLALVAFGAGLTWGAAVLRW